MKYTDEEVAELKKTFKGKIQLFKQGVKENKIPPMYRISLMNTLLARVTMYLILFVCVYLITIKLWYVSLILFPMGVIGNYYNSKKQYLEYSNIKKQYEYAKLIQPIELDISKTRRKYRIIESVLGLKGVDITLALFTLLLISLVLFKVKVLTSFIIILSSLPILIFIFYKIIYKLCYIKYNNGK